MLRLNLSRIADVIRTDGWWLGPQAVVVVVLSLTVGIWGFWLTYAAFNSALVLLYAAQHGPRSHRRVQTALKVLAIPLLPGGILSSLTSGRSVRDKVSGYSPHAPIRRAVSQKPSTTPWGNQ